MTRDPDVDPSGATATSGAGGAAVGHEPLVAGGHLGKYVLDRVLGTGGMGVVWAAHDPDLDREVALKVLRAGDSGPAQRTRLLREARAMARLKHPNVLTVYEVGTEDDRDFIAMELVDGGSLDGWLRGRPARREREAALLAAGRGLAAAHAAGLVHRDFKPHNVLRSRDGRVLVTDFGLARGQGPAMARADAEADPPAPAPPSAATDETLAASDETAPTRPPRSGSGSGSGRRDDGLLHSPLTATGAMVGTPAYMAPEQFAGAAPDPRTDQFAFCVAAWEALAGARPYRGDTIDELRRAVGAGTRTGGDALSRRVRRVLERGLAPDPARRWPDLDALLGALDRARRVSRIWIGAAIAVAAAAGGLAIFAARGRAPAPPAEVADCEAPATAFDVAWSPARRAELAPRFASAAKGFAVAAGAVDDYRKRWIDAYVATCAQPSSPSFHPRLGCLLGQRDDLAMYSRMMDRVPPEAMAHVDLFGALPRLALCTGDTPIAPPAMPADPALRERIEALRAALGPGTMMAPPDPSRSAKLLAEAKQIGWPPLVAEAQFGAASAADRAGDQEAARRGYREAANLASSANYVQIAAIARVGLLEPATHAPSDPTRDDEYDDALAQARAAIHAAGDDPSLLATVDLLVGDVAEGQGRHDDAAELYFRARQTYADAGDARRMNYAAVRYGQAALAAGRSSDRGAIERVLRETLDRRVHIAGAANIYVPQTQRLLRLLGEVEWRGGELGNAHAWLDMGGPKRAIAASTITGHVIDLHGAAVAGARVVAWSGALDGDAARAWLAEPDVAGGVATTGADGAFTLHVAGPRAAILAEAPAPRAGRSRPIAVDVGGAPVALRLGPVTALTATVTGAPAGARAFARIDTDAGAWRQVAPVGDDDTASLASFPLGAAIRGAEADDGDAHRVITAAGRDGAIAWPTGATVDVIVRGAPAASVWLVRGKVTATTAAALDAAARAATDVSDGEPELVAPTSATAAGRAVYRAGDRHVRFAAEPPGDATACAVRAADQRVICQPIQVDAAPVDVVVLPVP